MKKLTLVLDQTNWLEATWIKDDVQVHCESYSGHKEHISMLRSKALEFETSLDEYEDLIKQAEDAYVYPTYEEIKAQELAIKLAEAKAYLESTDWYIIRCADNGKEVPSDIKIKREEARISIGGINE